MGGAHGALRGPARHVKALGVPGPPKGQRVPQAALSPPRGTRGHGEGLPAPRQDPVLSSPGSSPAAPAVCLAAARGRAATPRPCGRPGLFRSHQETEAPGGSQTLHPAPGLCPRGARHTRRQWGPPPIPGPVWGPGGGPELPYGSGGSLGLPSPVASPLGSCRTAAKQRDSGPRSFACRLRAQT